MKSQSDRLREERDRSCLSRRSLERRANIPVKRKSANEDIKAEPARFDCTDQRESDSPEDEDGDGYDLPYRESTGVQRMHLEDEADREWP